MVRRVPAFPTHLASAPDGAGTCIVTQTVGPTVEDGYVVDVFQLQVSTITPLPY